MARLPPWAVLPVSVLCEMETLPATAPSAPPLPEPASAGIGKVVIRERIQEVGATQGLVCCERAVAHDKAWRRRREEGAIANGAANCGADHNVRRRAAAGVTVAAALRQVVSQRAVGDGQRSAIVPDTTAACYAKQAGAQATWERDGHAHRTATRGHGLVAGERAVVNGDRAGFVVDGAAERIAAAGTPESQITRKGALRDSQCRPRLVLHPATPTGPVAEQAASRHPLRHVSS